MNWKIVWVTLICSCVSAPPEGARRSPVIDGAESPSDLGFEIDAFQRDAVVGQIASVGGERYQGCSGTIAGDRLVVLAGHCVVMNQEEWITNGDEPEVIDAAMLSYVVGDDAEDPDCELQAEEVHLHPDITIGMMAISHDVALVELADSVLETCPQVVPIAINREPLTEDIYGAEVLQGGYGSTDGTYDFSPVRYWSLMELTSFTPDGVVFEDIGQGFPTYGDSGSGALHRFDDGVIRNLGVASSGETAEEMRFARLDAQEEFLDDVLSTRLVCGPAAAGVCRDDLLLTCADDEFQTTDCSSDGRSCRVDFGAGACVCTCDEDGPYCDESCDCDPDCPCECDESDECDEDCGCDPDCQGVGDDDDDDEDNDDDGGCAVAAPRPATCRFGELLRLSW